MIEDFFYVRERYYSERGRWFPAVDLLVTEEHVILFIELPGMSKDDVEITVGEDFLEIKGVKKEPDEFKIAVNFYMLESSYGSFSRVIELPCNVQSDGVETNFTSGLLKISIPRRKEKIVEIPIE